jgi:hypothetical protein
MLDRLSEALCEIWNGHKRCLSSMCTPAVVLVYDLLQLSFVWLRTCKCSTWLILYFVPLYLRGTNTLCDLKLSEVLIFGFIYFIYINMYLN